MEELKWSGPWGWIWVLDRIGPMVELIHCSHRTVYTNQTICWDPIETKKSEATIPRRSWGESMITVTTGSKLPGTNDLGLWWGSVVYITSRNMTRVSPNFASKRNKAKRKQIWAERNSEKRVCIRLFRFEAKQNICIRNEIIWSEKYQK